MDSFGKKLRECRETKNLSQNELANLIEAHHSIIGKYERDEVKPSIDVVKKMAQVLETTVGYLLGENKQQDVLKDPKMLKRITDIENLPEKDKECLLLTIDNFIKATKLNAL
jgi:transcriptional regulator with XRE-family HTH domain